MGILGQPHESIVTQAEAVPFSAAEKPQKERNILDPTESSPNYWRHSGPKNWRQTPGHNNYLNSALGTIPCTGIPGWAMASQSIFWVAVTCPEQ